MNPVKTKEKAEQKINKIFLTDKYKRFFYPTRPFITLALIFILPGLQFIGILPLSLALWLAGLLIFSDLPLTPLMSLITAANNLVNGRKLIKSLIMISTVTLAALMGGVVGFFVLIHSPTFMALISSIIKVSGASPFLVFIGTILGGLIAHETHIISPLTGFFIGSFVLILFPITIPTVVDVLFICSAGLAALTSMVTKKCLRAYYKSYYGHSNADGYQMDRTAAEQMQFIEDQALKFAMPIHAFQKLTNLCREKIKLAKNNTSFIEEQITTRQLITNSFKDIYHGLMNPNASKNDIAATKQLLHDSTAKCSPATATERLSWLVTPSFIVNASYESRLKFHCAHLNAEVSGLNEQEIVPLLVSIV